MSHYLDLLASRGGGGETVINPIDYSENVYLDGGIVHLLDTIGYQSNRSSLPGPLSYSLLSTHYVEERLFGEYFLQKAFYEEIGRYGQEGVSLFGEGETGSMLPDWGSFFTLYDAPSTSGGMIATLDLRDINFSSNIALAMTVKVFYFEPPNQVIVLIIYPYSCIMH